MSRVDEVTRATITANFHSWCFRGETGIKCAFFTLLGQDPEVSGESSNAPPLTARVFVFHYFR